MLPRRGNIPGRPTKQFCNFANFQIATNGLQGSNVNLGELWVTYEVCLMKPIVPSVAGVTGGVFLRYSATGCNDVYCYKQRYTISGI